MISRLFTFYLNTCLFYLYCTYVFIYKSIFGEDEKRFTIKNDPNFEKNLFIDSRKEYVRKLDLLSNSVEPELYDAVKYKELLQIENSEIETKWKSSILFDSIPGGNVIMYYDIFRHSFSYYSDTVMATDLLNMVALKYVTMFHCKDFFVDTSEFTLEDDDIVYTFQSPLIKVFEEYEKLATTDSSTAHVYEANEMNDAQANRLKKIRENMKTVAKAVNKNSSLNKKKGNIVKHINKFVYMGKIANFSFLKKIDIQNTSEVFETIFTLTSELQEQSEFMRGIKIIQPPTNKLVDTKKTWKDFCEEKRKAHVNQLESSEI
jgi:hypothetical protein